MLTIVRAFARRSEVVAIVLTAAFVAFGVPVLARAVLLPVISGEAATVSAVFFVSGVALVALVAALLLMLYPG